MQRIRESSWSALRSRIFLRVFAHHVITTSKMIIAVFVLNSKRIRSTIVNEFAIQKRSLRFRSSSDRFVARISFSFLFLLSKLANHDQSWMRIEIFFLIRNDCEEWVICLRSSKSFSTLTLERSKRSWNERKTTNEFVTSDHVCDEIITSDHVCDEVVTSDHVCDEIVTSDYVCDEIVTSDHVNDKIVTIWTRKIKSCLREIAKNDER